MATFPSAIPNPDSASATEVLNNLGSGAGLAQMLNDINGEITALAVKIGTGSATPANHKFLKGTSNGVSTWAAVDLSTADVTGTLPVANGGTGLASMAEIAEAVGNLLFPIGCIYTETTGTNPNTLLGFGTWTAFGGGRVLVGNGTSDQAFAAGASGGESTHTLVAAEMPSHTHTVANVTGINTQHASAITAGSSNNSGVVNNQSSAATSSAGSDGAHNNLQPYIVVYFWKRTA